MKFIVLQCMKDPDYFIVTDRAHRPQVDESTCPSGGELKEIGEYEEMGELRAAFDEQIAKNSIDKQGFYLFVAESFAAVPRTPEMPG